MPSAVKMQSPYHWTAREFPVLKFAKRKTEVKFPLSQAIGRTSLWLSLAGQTNSDSLGLPGSWALRKEKRNSCLLNRPCRRNRMAYSLQEKQDLEALGPNQKCKKKKKKGGPFSTRIAYKIHKVPDSQGVSSTPYVWEIVITGRTSPGIQDAPRSLDPRSEWAERSPPLRCGT